MLVMIIIFCFSIRRKLLVGFRNLKLLMNQRLIVRMVLVVFMVLKYRNSCALYYPFQMEIASEMMVLLNYAMKKIFSVFPREVS